MVYYLEVAVLNEFSNLSICLLFVLNTLMSLIIIIWDLYYYFKTDEAERWTKLLYSVVGFFWFIRCLLFFFDVKPFGFEDVNLAILTLITFTLLSMAVASIIRVGRDFDMRNPVKDIVVYVSKKVISWIMPKS